MTICRYFLQGNCRFGDRCRFEHTESNYNSQNNYYQRNVGNYQERYGRQDTGYSNYRNDYQHRNQAYESNNNYTENQRGYSPGRYSEKRYESPTRHPSAYDNQHQSRPRHDYEQQPRYNEQNYGRNQQYSTRNYQNENAYGQNRFQWLSDDYKRQSQNVPHNRNEYVNDSYKTSTPKGKIPFSFKVPESEIKKGNNFFSLTEQEQLHVNMVKEEAKAWELGGQWPFTCYFPSVNKYAFPGFYDVSPEELRYAAYKAENNNCYESYVQSVQNALAQINQQRSLLQTPTPELLSVLKQIRDGSDLYSTSKKIDPIPIIQGDENVLESMETPSFLTPANNAASFSFKMATEVDSPAITSAANFSFKLPVGTEIKAVPSAASDGDPYIYTPLEKLTEEEKKQFTASTFVLGKIPTKPPSQALCS